MPTSRQRGLRRERYLISPGNWGSYSPTRYLTAGDRRNGRRSRFWPGNESRRQQGTLATVLTTSSLLRQMPGWGKVSHRRGECQVVVVPSRPTEGLCRDGSRGDYQGNCGVSTASETRFPVGHFGFACLRAGCPTDDAHELRCEDRERTRSGVEGDSRSRANRVL